MPDGFSHFLKHTHCPENASALQPVHIHKNHAFSLVLPAKNHPADRWILMPVFPSYAQDCLSVLWSVHRPAADCRKAPDTARSYRFLAVP